MLHTVILIGRSGCGKGTQAALLRDRFHKRDLDKRQILYVETGDRFRQFIREKTFSAKLAKEVNDSGGLQPPFLAAWMWGNVLIEELGPDMHLMFDGAPRALSEAELLTTAFHFFGRKKVTVIYLNVSKKWSEERLLSRGRSDDANLKKIHNKLKWFDENVLPVIEFFKKNPLYKVIEINGEQPIEKVQLDIIAAYDYK
jgi:adenylate kinase